MRVKFISVGLSAILLLFFLTGNVWADNSANHRQNHKTGKVRKNTRQKDMHGGATHFAKDHRRYQKAKYRALSDGHLTRTEAQRLERMQFNAGKDMGHHGRSGHSDYKRKYCKHHNHKYNDRRHHHYHHDNGCSRHYPKKHHRCRVSGNHPDAAWGFFFSSRIY